MMGMGEPLANFDNVVSAMRIMLDDNGYGLSRRRVTLSTSGIVPAMDRLAAELPVALAVSLHAPDDQLRDRLVPINKKYPLKELMAACKRYIKVAPRDFVTFEYVMLDGVNDSVEHAMRLVSLVKGVRCKFNLIPFNAFPDSGFRRSSPERISCFPRRADAGGSGDDNAQDPRRRHRWRLRPTGRPGAGPNQGVARAAQLEAAGMTRVMTLRSRGHPGRLRNAGAEIRIGPAEPR